MTSGWGKWQSHNFIRHIFPSVAELQTEKPLFVINREENRTWQDRVSGCVLSANRRKGPHYEGIPVTTWVIPRLLFYTDWSTLSCTGRWVQFVAIPPALNNSLLVRGESFLNQGVNRIHELQRLRLTRLQPTISTVMVQGEVMLITQEAGGSSYTVIVSSHWCWAHGL